MTLGFSLTGSKDQTVSLSTVAGRERIKLILGNYSTYLDSDQ